MKIFSHKIVVSVLLSSILVISSGCSVITDKSDENVEKASAILDTWRGTNNEVLEEANALLSKALLLNPKSVSARIEMGRYHIMSHHLKEAENVLKEAEKIDPNDANVYVLLGHLYYLQKRYDEGLNVLEKAEEIGTDNPWLYMNKADILSAQFKDEEALLLREKAINHPKITVKLKRNVTGDLADYYWLKKDDLKKAEKYYNMQVNTDPKYYAAYSGRANFYACTTHDFVKAKKDINKALDILKKSREREAVANRFSIVKRFSNRGRMVDLHRDKGSIYWLEWQKQYENNDPKAKRTYKLAKKYTFNHAIHFVSDTCLNKKSWRDFANVAGKAFAEGVDFNPNDLARFYHVTGKYDKVKELSKHYDIKERFKKESIGTQEDYFKDQCYFYARNCDKIKEDMQ